MPCKIAVVLFKLLVEALGGGEQRTTAAAKRSHRQYPVMYFNIKYLSVPESINKHPQNHGIDKKEGCSQRGRRRSPRHRGSPKEATIQRQCDPHGGMKGKPLLQQRYPRYVISLRESADGKAIKPTAETTEPAQLR